MISEINFSKTFNVYETENFELLKFQNVKNEKQKFLVFSYYKYLSRENLWMIKIRNENFVFLYRYLSCKNFCETENKIFLSCITM